MVEMIGLIVDGLKAAPGDSQKARYIVPAGCAALNLTIIYLIAMKRKK